MSRKLAQEIRQGKPFASREEEAFLNLGRTWEALSTRLAETLKPFELTATQYNVLRILRGAGAAGLTCSETSERMIKSDPDMTRLFDRLEARGLIRRERSAIDRRIVVVTIADAGRRILEDAQPSIDEFHRRNLGRLSPERLAGLIEALEELRETRP